MSGVPPSLYPPISARRTSNSSTATTAPSVRPQMDSRTAGPAPFESSTSNRPRYPSETGSPIQTLDSGRFESDDFPDVQMEDEGLNQTATLSLTGVVSHHLDSNISQSQAPRSSPTPTSSLPQSTRPIVKPKVSHARKTPEGHVKRPPNAFILYRSHCCLSTPGDPDDPPAPSAAQLAELGITDHRHISRIVSHLWTSLPPGEKLYWENKAKAKKEEHNRLHPDYKFKPVYRNKNEVRRKRRAGEGEVEMEKKGCAEVAMALLSREVDDGSVSFGAVRTIEQHAADLGSTLPKKRRPHRRTRPRESDELEPIKSQSKAKPAKLAGSPRSNSSSSDSHPPYSNFSRSQTAPPEPIDTYPESHSHRRENSVDTQRFSLPPQQPDVTYDPTYLERLIQASSPTFTRRTSPPALDLPPDPPYLYRLNSSARRNSVEMEPSSRLIDQSALAHLRRYNLIEANSDRFPDGLPRPTTSAHSHYSPTQIDEKHTQYYQQPPPPQYARRGSSVVAPAAFRGLKRGEADRFATVGAGDLMLTSPTFAHRSSSIGRWSQEGELLHLKQEEWASLSENPDAPSNALVFNTEQFLRSVETGAQELPPNGTRGQYDPLQQTLHRRRGSIDSNWGRRASDSHARSPYHVGDSELFTSHVSPVVNGSSQTRSSYHPLPSASSSSTASSSHQFHSDRQYTSSTSSYATTPNSPGYESPLFANSYSESPSFTIQAQPSNSLKRPSMGSLVAASSALSQFSAHGELATLSQVAELFVSEDWSMQGSRGSKATRGNLFVAPPGRESTRRAPVAGDGGRVAPQSRREEPIPMKYSLTREDANNVPLVQHLLDLGHEVSFDPATDSSFFVPA